MHLWCITVSGERNVQAVLRGGFVQLGRKNRLQLLSVKRPTDSGPIPQQTRAEQNISWIRALACLAPMDFHLVSPYVFEVHDCSALHVCSFILSILHQASFFFADVIFVGSNLPAWLPWTKTNSISLAVGGLWVQEYFWECSSSILDSKHLLLQGIFSVSAFIVSVIYLSRQKQTWNLLDISPINLGKSATTPRINEFVPGSWITAEGVLSLKGS